MRGQARRHSPSGDPLHVVGVPVFVDGSEVAVVGVNALQPSHVVLGLDIPLQHGVAALLRRGVQLQRVAVALVAPGNLVAVLHDLVETIGADALAALVVFDEGLRLRHRPEQPACPPPAASKGDWRWWASVSS